MFKKEDSTKKSDQTRKKLYQVAMDMFAKNGFDKTTMRAIATEAGVAPGATYYYFESKEAIIYEYYKQLHTDHVKALEGILENEPSFSKRLHHVVTSKIEVALPFKNMVRAIYRIAANPESPLSPFSQESKTGQEGPGIEPGGARV